MKKLFAFISLAAVMASFAACGDTAVSGDTDTAKQTREETVLSEETSITVTESTASETTVTSEDISETQETTLSEEAPAVSKAADNEPQIRVEWADEADLTAGYDECEIFEPTEGQARVAFTSDAPVNGFTILELTFTDCSDEGVITFSAYPAASPDQEPELTPGKTLVIGFDFVGDIPQYGFQYEDADGDIRRFALEISGEDGSLLIREASREYYEFVLE